MKLIVLDRDGVINEDSDAYIKSPAEFIPIPGSLEAISRLKRSGYTVVVASNQSGIARGLFDLATLQAIHDKLQHLLAQHQVQLDGIFYCPHGPDDACDCRKPRSGLLMQIQKKYSTSMENVPVVGDALRDIQAAQAVGAEPVLVRTGKGERTLQQGKGLDGVPVYADLSEYVDVLLERKS